MVAERAPFVPETAVTNGVDRPARPHLQALHSVRQESPQVLTDSSVYPDARIISRSPGLTVLELNTPKHNYGEYNLNRPGMLEIFLREASATLIGEYRADQRIIRSGGEAPKQRVWILGS